MPDTPTLPDAATRRRIGPWQPDRLASLADFGTQLERARRRVERALATTP